MEGAAQSPLVAWHDFYVIVGSSGAALTGLQFVVIALVANSKRQSSLREIEAFGSPTIVHFSSVLLISAILSAPWQGLSGVSLALGACGILGVIYGAITVWRARRLDTYRAIPEEWVWFVILPLLAYTSLAISSLLLPNHPQSASFVIGATVVLLLLIGIHNAWDSVTFIAVGDYDKQNSQEPSEGTE